MDLFCIAASLYIMLFFALKIKMLHLLFLSMSTVICTTGKDQNWYLCLVSDHYDTLKFLYYDG